MIGANPRDQQVPDVRGQAAGRRHRDAAEPRLQDPRPSDEARFDGATRPRHRHRSRGQHRGERGRRDHHQRLDGAGAARGSRREVADAFAMRRTSSSAPASTSSTGRLSSSLPEQKDRVIGTNPPANQTSAITNVITIIVGFGPGQRAGPGLRRARRSTSASRSWPRRDFRQPSAGRRRQQPALRSGGRHQSACGRERSEGHPDPDPGVARQPVHHAEPGGSVLGGRRAATCACCGWTGGLVRGPDMQNSGQRTNAVVTQSPPAGHHGELRQSRHAELRVVAARTVSATSCSSRLTRCFGGRLAAQREPVGQHPVAALGQDRLGVELDAVDRELDVLHAHDDAALGARGDLQLIGQGVGQDRQRVVAGRRERIRKSLQHTDIRVVARCWSCRAAVPVRDRPCRRTPRRSPGGRGRRRAVGSRRRRRRAPAGWTRLPARACPGRG